MVAYNNVYIVCVCVCQYVTSGFTSAVRSSFVPVAAPPTNDSGVAQFTSALSDTPLTDF